MVEKHEPAPGKDGRVLYTFGTGLPTIVCAPLRVCVLELEPGEKMVGEPHIGDSVRWTISPAAAGKPEAQMIVIKPKQAGLDTNLLVPTDRRAYYVRLVSKPDDYLARVAFAYPDEENAKWQQHFQQEEVQRRKQQAESSVIAPVDSIESLYFDYRVSGGDEYLRPVRVVDDGRKTFVQMPAGTTVWETPVLVVVGTNGPEMVNYRVKGDMYIVDRLFERGALILGVGKKQRRADIVRGVSRQRCGQAAQQSGCPAGSGTEERSKRREIEASRWLSTRMIFTGQLNWISIPSRPILFAFQSVRGSSALLSSAWWESWSSSGLPRDRTASSSWAFTRTRRVT